VSNDYYVFSGRIYRVGLIRYVDVPADISRVLGEGATHVPVEGEVEGTPLKTTMVSRGKGCYRLAIHGDIRKRLKADAGTVVEVALRRDAAPPEPVLPPTMVLALRNSPKAQAEFRRMTTALRRQIVRYITQAKQQATRERRVATLMRSLEKRGREHALKQAKRRKR
jgi:hypothetical protein